MTDDGSEAPAGAGAGVFILSRIPHTQTMRVTLFSEVIPPIQDGVCHTLTNLSASLEEEGIGYQVISGVAPAPADITSAATPLTCGAAMDVPW